MATSMKLEEKLQKVSEKNQRRMDKVGFTLGLLLLAASFASYYVLEAYGEVDLFSLNCPENAYHGLDNQGNAACRDIISNEVVEPIATITIDSGNQITDSPRGIFVNSATDEIPILNDENADYSGFVILSIIGAVLVAVIVFRKNVISTLSQIRGWDSVQKEQVRKNQYGLCNICYRKPTKWVYDHIDGNKRNNDISNCQGLCPKCKSEKMMVKI